MLGAPRAVRALSNPKLIWMAAFWAIISWPVFAVFLGIDWIFSREAVFDRIYFVLSLAPSCSSLSNVKTFVFLSRVRLLPLFTGWPGLFVDKTITQSVAIDENGMITRTVGVRCMQHCMYHCMCVGRILLG